MEYRFIDVSPGTTDQHRVPVPKAAPKQSSPAVENPGFVKFVSSPKPIIIQQTMISSQGQEAGSTSSPDSDTITIAAPSAHQLPEPDLSFGERKLGKLHTQYMLSDGSVVTGKGLGRGRPGIKRGPRKSKLSEEVITQTTVDTPSTSNSPASLDQVTTPNTITPSRAYPKRKRADSDASIIRVDDAELTPSSRESTPEYNPTSTHTRSGRQTLRPASTTATNNPESPSTNARPTSATANNNSPAPKRPSLHKTDSTITPKRHPKIKPKIYRGREAFALCEHCLRGNGPTGNVIVFCDACNKCWHQRCHDPQISKEVVADKHAEWFCSGCDRILHGRKKVGRPPTKVPQQQVVVPTPAPTVQQQSPPQPPAEPKYGPPLIDGIGLSFDQKREYLQTLSKERLIALCLHISDLAPDLRIFETLHPPAPPPQAIPHRIPPQPSSNLTTFPITPTFQSTYVTPVDKPTFNDNANGTSGSGGIDDEIEDEGYVDDYDEHAALYPKPGMGVQLPHDSVDLEMLLEGPGVRTFSHWVKGMEVRAAV